MRAAIYARVSSQVQRERHTIENQLRTLTAFVSQQRWQLIGTYVDDGRSAKAGKLEARDGFARLQRDAAAAVFDVLVVVDIDRLTRTDDLQERAQILGPFQRAGIQIVTPSGGALDLRTMLGELYVTMQALVAAEENRKRAERVKAGKLRAIAEGRKPAGPTPYGLAYDRVAGQWSIDPPRAAVVREIFKRVVDGDSCQIIAEDLHARAVVSPRGPWERTKVWSIVRSRHPVGEWIADKRQRLAIRVPPIIDEAIWLEAQDRLQEHGKRGLRRTKHVYLLEALATCAQCGSPILIRSPNRNQRGWLNPPAYVCRARKLARIGEQRCNAPIALVAETDDRAWEKIAETLVSDELAADLQRKAEAASANRRSWASDIAGHRAHLTRLDRVESGVLARWRKGTVSDGALDHELAAIRRERTAVQRQLEVAELAAQDRGVEPDAHAFLAQLRALADTRSPEDRRRVVVALIRPGGVVLDQGAIALTLQISDASARSRGGVPVLASGCRTRYEHAGNAIEIKVVA